MTRPILPLLIAGLLASMPSYAATVIETRESDDPAPSVMTVEGHQARMQTSAQQYVLVDTRERRYLAVDLAAGHIIDMASAPPKAESAGQPRRPVPTDLVHVGRGPLTAGFPTEHYRLVAAGRICSNTFLSKAALEAAGMKEFMGGFREFLAEQKAAYAEAGADYEPCEEAHQVAVERYLDGMPLKTMDTDDFLRQEVVRICTDVPVARNFFVPPTGLRAMTLEQFLRQDIDDEHVLQQLMKEDAEPAQR
jgi:hypothetical protein